MGSGRGFGTNIATKGGKPVAIFQRDIRKERNGANNLLEEMSRRSLSFTKENIIFAARLKSGKIVFLETGNEKNGLAHIEVRHASQFKTSFRVKRNQIPGFILEAMAKWDVTESKPTTNNEKGGYENRYYKVGKTELVVIIGSDGYIVTAYPFSNEDE